jgi:hypothetical protein
MSWTRYKSDGCPFCLDLDPERLSTATFHESPKFAFANVVAAAEQGCEGCRVLRFAVKPCLENENINSKEFHLQLKHLNHTFTCRVYQSSSSTKYIENFEIFVTLAVKPGSFANNHF